MACFGPQDPAKSYLMFVVHEEMETLKEQIRDLEERNVTLEQENSLLRTMARPEHLAQMPSSGLPQPRLPTHNEPSPPRACS